MLVQPQSQNGGILDLETYPDRIIVFIDILGFSRDVMAVKERPGLFVSIEALLRRIANCKADIDKKRLGNSATHDVRMTHFSDCLVISFAMSPGVMSRALANSAFIAQTILRRGYLPRGAITRGPLLHDEDIVFGTALIDAYQLEQSVAKTPRIFISNNVTPLIEEEIPKSELLKFVRDYGQDPFVHVLSDSWPFVAQAEHEIPGGFREMFEELRDSLPIRYSNAPDNDAREKISWFREYANRTADEIGLPTEVKILPLR